MKAAFFRPHEPEMVVGTATWDGVRVSVQADDHTARETLNRIFRVSPVVADDPVLRPAGARGESVVEPGDLEWFRAAARVRGEAEGLDVRFAPETTGGWDPAGAYDPMDVWTAKREAPDQPIHSLGTSRA